MRRFCLLILCAGGMMLSAHLWAQNQPSDPMQQSPSQAQAQTWAGTLVDAECKAASANARCPITESTKTFGFETSDGTYVKLDDSGNTKVRSAIDSADQSKRTGRIKAQLAGSLSGDMLTVSSVQIQ
jgi:hypothetical protein